MALGTLTLLYTELHNQYHYSSWECPTLWDPMDYSPVHGVPQARILEWVAISSSRGSSPLSYQSLVSSTAGRFFTAEPPGKPKIYMTCITLAVLSEWFSDIKHTDTVVHWLYNHHHHPSWALENFSTTPNWNCAPMKQYLFIPSSLKQFFFVLKKCRIHII